MTAFLDPLARIFDDPDQAHGEQRFLLVGVSATSHLLVVVHVERGDSLRIVSARLATKRERFNLETES
ncbi:MAG: BrnT family toxin [Myxococcota bacterium]|nr:BrnT family toxin [Myxococcota bacterium]